MDVWLGGTVFQQRKLLLDLEEVSRNSEKVPSEATYSYSTYPARTTQPTPLSSNESFEENRSHVLNQLQSTDSFTILSFHSTAITTCILDLQSHLAYLGRIVISENGNEIG